MNSISPQQEKQSVDILCKQMLSRHYASAVQVLFQEHRNEQTGVPEGKKEPVKLYINHTGSNHENPLHDITDVILSPADKPSSIIICSSKLRVSFYFKVLLLVKFQNVPVPTLIILPGDIGSKCMAQSDLSHPQYNSRGNLTEVMRIAGENFAYTAEIPLCEFDKLPTREQLHDQTLESSTIIKNTKWIIDSGGTCNHGAGSPPASCTAVSLSVAQDILTRITVERDISIECINHDFI